MQNADFRLGLCYLEGFESAALFPDGQFLFVLSLLGIVGNGRFVSGIEMMQKTTEIDRIKQIGENGLIVRYV